MLTSHWLPSSMLKADVKGYCRFGNSLFTIAGIIGIATYHGYEYAFAPWSNQEYFVNPLPVISVEEAKAFKKFVMPHNYLNKYDVGFVTWDVPDNSAVKGFLETEKYFKHCEDLIRHYFTMKDLCEPYRDCIIINYREYYTQYHIKAKMTYEYFQKALSLFPNKRVVVVTNDVVEARNVIREDFEYVDVSPIVDFYYLTKAENLIISNSTFSWWGAWLSKARTVAPAIWNVGDFGDFPMEDLLCPEWTLI